MSAFLVAIFSSPIVINAAGALVAAVISWGAWQLGKFVKSKTNNEKYTLLTQRMSNAVVDAVKAVNQEFVSTLKKEGKWTAATAIEAKSKALGRAVAILGKATSKEISSVIGYDANELEKVLGVLIESAVGAYKANNIEVKK